MVARPVLLMKMICAAELVPTACSPKLRLPGLMTMLARGTLMPLPLKLMPPLPCWAVVLTLMMPPSGPGVSGEKVMLTAQPPPGWMVPAQVLVKPKSPTLLTLRTSKGPLPTLLTVAVRGGLVLPTFWLPKSKLAGLMLMAEIIGTAMLMLVPRLAWPALLVARRVKVKNPAVVGVPEILPVLLLRLRPGGSAPAGIDQVIGVVPVATGVKL